VTAPRWCEGVVGVGFGAVGGDGKQIVDAGAVDIGADGIAAGVHFGDEVLVVVDHVVCGPAGGDPGAVSGGVIAVLLGDHAVGGDGGDLVFAVPFYMLSSNHDVVHTDVKHFRSADQAIPANCQIE